MKNFITGIKTNLHIAMIMDCSNNSFTLNCESNPALYKECAVQWMESWSRDSMVKVSAYLQKLFGQTECPYRGYISDILGYGQCPSTEISFHRDI